MVRSATVAGRLEGILIVRDMLTMRSSGHCDGVLRYGQLNVQVISVMVFEGGKGGGGDWVWWRW